MKDDSRLTENIDFSKEHRQAPIGLVLFFFDTVRKLVKGIWPLIIIFFFNKDNEEGKNEWYFYLSLAASVFIIINSLFSYWFFKFQIIDGVLIVKKGYLKKVRLSIPLERIQTINTKQNVVQKALGLLSLEIDTAGAKDTEIEFIAIRKETAEAIEHLFNQYKPIHREPDTIEQDANFAKKEESILNLSLTDLVKVGLSENHIKSFFIAFGIMYGFYYQLKDVFEERVEELTAQGIQLAEELSQNVFIAIGIAVLIISILISFFRIIYKFYNLKLSRVEKGLKVQFGLLNTKEVHIPISKIQLISFHNNPLRQWLKFRTLKIKQAVSGEQFKKTQSIQIPACNYSDAQLLQEVVLEKSKTDYSENIFSHWFYFVRSFLIISLLTSVAYYFLKDQAWWVFTVYIGLELLWAGLTLLSYQKRYFKINDENLFISKGTIAGTHYYLSFHKIQSVQFKQNIFAKRRAVASLQIYTASGTNLSLPYIPETLAKDLYKYILYKIESSEKTWM